MKKYLYLLDRNIISFIKEFNEGKLKPNDERKKEYIEQLNKIKRLKEKVIITPISSIFEGNLKRVYIKKKK